MTDNPIHVARADDADRFLATDQTVWFAEIPAAPPRSSCWGCPADQRFAADVEDSDPASYPGVYGVYPMTLSVPGPDAGVRQVPCAGLTWVGVHPDHRRRGVLTAMMRHHLEQVHEEQGTHVSALHASEPAIYGRYGYGLASLEHEVTLGRVRRSPRRTSTRLPQRRRPGWARVSDPEVPKRMRECHLATAEVGRVVGERRLLRAGLPAAAGAAARQGAVADPVRPAGRGRRRLRDVPPHATSGSTPGPPASCSSGRWWATRRPGSPCSGGWSTST